MCIRLGWGELLVGPPTSDQAAASSRQDATYCDNKGQALSDDKEHDQVVQRQIFTLQ